MNKYWAEFWRCTFSYLTPEGVLDAMTSIWPQWLDDICMAIWEFLGAMLAVTIVVLLFYPISILVMLLRTPLRIQKTLEAIRNGGWQ